MVGSFLNAEARNRPLRAPTTHGEVGRPSEASAERREVRRGWEIATPVGSVPAKFSPRLNSNSER